MFNQRIWRFFLLTFLGLMVSLSITISTHPSFANSSAQQLLQQGIEDYKMERFAAAAIAWQEAAISFAQQENILPQALALSNLSLAHQRLGQWQEAKQAIDDSFGQLQTLAPREGESAYQEVFAKALNTQGRWYWGQGNLEVALESWQQAARHYLGADNLSGIAIAKINQAKALQALGFSRQAGDLLQQVNRALAQQPDSQLQVISLRNLGTALRQLGDLPSSREILADSLAKVQSDKERQLILLELGNTERALFNRAVILGNKEARQEHLDAALAFYQQAKGQLQAQLNQLSLLIETGNTEAALGLWADLQQVVESLPPSRNGINARLNLAESLVQLSVISYQSPVTSHQSPVISSENPPLAQPTPNPSKEGNKRGMKQEGNAHQEIHQSSVIRQGDEVDKGEITHYPLPITHYLTSSRSLATNIPTQEDISGLLATAVQQARSLQDPRAESYALGQLGRFYELKGQWLQAQELTQKALLKAENIQAADLRYRWEWQLGRLRDKQRDRKGAINAYNSAIATLQSLRGDLLSVNQEVQFSFRDNVEPIYREFVRLLLAHSNNSQPSAQNLRRAIRSVDALQLAELENFLGCSLGTLAKLEQLDMPQSALIYPIILPDRLAIISMMPGQEQSLAYQETLIPQQEVEATLKALRRDLTIAANTPEVMASAQKLYTWLIKPLEPFLQENADIENLVFVLDGLLRNVPMAVLHDGEKFLIEQGYTIAVAPRLELFNPEASSPQLLVKTGGVGVSQKIDNISFPPIEKLSEELERIGEEVNTSQPLVDEEFTLDNLRQQLQVGNFSAIHWKTHGVFSSDPQETYIVAYNERIKAQELNSLIQTGRTTPLDLLVLSACETAQGDERAVLGLAGIAVRTGAKSVVSTLWTAQDAPNTEFMVRFYGELAEGATKAQAIARSQLALMRDYGYTTPHIWATYVLVGNWL